MRQGALEWQAAGNILKVNLPEFADKFVLEYKRTKGVRNDSKIFGVSN